MLKNIREQDDQPSAGEREFFIDYLLVHVHRCFGCTGLAPWEFESPFPGSLISTFLGVTLGRFGLAVRVVK